MHTLASDVGPAVGPCPRHLVEGSFRCSRCAGAGCARCQVDSPWGPLCESCVGQLELAEARERQQSFPLETRPGAGFWSALIPSAWAMSFDAKSAWRDVPADGPLGRPLAFGAAMTALQLSWPFLLAPLVGGFTGGSVDGDAQGVARGVGMGLGVALALFVAWVGGGLALLGVESIAIRLLGGTLGWRPLLRTYCYSQAPGLTGPIAGLFEIGCSLPITPLWSRYARALAFERYAGLGPGQAKLAAFGPYGLGFLLFVTGSFVLVIVAAGR